MGETESSAGEGAQVTLYAHLLILAGCAIIAACFWSVWKPQRRR
jgi:hypothetical protein